MSRKKMTADAAKKFTGKVRAKNKRKQDAALEKSHTEHSVKKVKTAEKSSDPKNVHGGELRGVMMETMARVYEEMWPSMSPRDSAGTVDIEIQEEAYILQLTMICGTDNYKPRRALKIRDAFVPGLTSYCREHREAA